MLTFVQKLIMALLYCLASLGHLRYHTQHHLLTSVWWAVYWYATWATYIFDDAIPFTLVMIHRCHMCREETFNRLKANMCTQEIAQKCLRDGAWRRLIWLFSHTNTTRSLRAAQDSIFMWVKNKFDVVLRNSMRRCTYMRGYRCAMVFEWFSQHTNIEMFL